MKHRLSIALIVSACVMALGSTASAALPSTGTLVKASGPAVYWYSKDGKRYVFPNEKMYKTWFADFSGVVTVSDAELASLMIGGNVTARPGVRLVKVTTDPKTYAVDTFGTLRWVTSESIASQLYGSNWNTKVDDVPDAFFVNYRVGAEIDSASQYSPSAAMASAPDIDHDLTPPPSCTADTWSCGDWNACTSGGTQTRSCTMTFDCPTASTPSPATSQSCTPPSNLPPLTGLNDDGLVVAGTKNLILAKYTLTAQGEQLKLTKVRMSLAFPASAADVLRLRLYDGTDPVSGDAIVGSDGNADFSGVDFTIPKDGSNVLTVAADLNTIPAGAKSGDEVAVKMHVPASDDGTYELRGTTTNTVLHSGSGGDKTGVRKILRKTVLTVTDADLPSSVIANGDDTAARFTVAADAADQAAFKKLTFSISKDSALAISAPELRVTGSGQDLASSATLSAGCGVAGTDCTVSLVLTDEQEISAGTAKTYDLRLMVSGVSGSSATIQTSLLNDAALVTGQLSGGGTGVAGTSRNFIWSDESGVPHNDADAGSSDWTDGLLVKFLPTDVQVLSK